MMNLSFLSPKTIARIARGSVSLEQNYYYHSHGWSNHYCVRVTYPNGYGASIIFLESDQDEEKSWEVAILKDGELLIEDDGYDYVWSFLSEEEVIDLCDTIFYY